MNKILFCLPQVSLLRVPIAIGIGGENKSENRIKFCGLKNKPLLSTFRSKLIFQVKSLWYLLKSKGQNPTASQVLHDQDKKKGNCRPSHKVLQLNTLHFYTIEYDPNQPRYSPKNETKKLKSSMQLVKSIPIPPPNKMADII